MENSRWNICLTNATQQVRQCGRTTANWIRYQYNRGRQQFHRTAKQTRSFRGNSNCSAASILSSSTAITTDTTSTLRISKQTHMRTYLLTFLSFFIHNSYVFGKMRVKLP